MVTASDTDIVERVKELLEEYADPGHVYDVNMDNIHPAEAFSRGWDCGVQNQLGIFLGIIEDVERSHALGKD